jgi:hypothetical protein
MQDCEIIRLTENHVAEGNVLEHPIFKLSNKMARPNRGRDKDGNVLLAKEDYISQYELAPGVKIIIEADLHHGYPTTFGMRVLLAVIQKSRSLGYPSRRVFITIAEIAQLLNLPHGGHQYSLIKKAILSLNGLRIIFENLWYDKINRTIIPITGAEHLVTDFQIGKVKKRSKPIQLEFDFVGDYIELGSRLFESLRAGYRIGIDLDYINELENPCSQRLYAYLTKKDGDGRVEYCESIVSLAKKLPLTATMPSDIIRILKPALEELKGQKQSGKRFLVNYKFVGSRRESQIIVSFSAASLRDCVRAMVNQNLSI